MTSAEHVLRLLKTEVRIAPDSLVRALMLVYLVDWKSSLDLGSVITESRWKKASWGPYSAEVMNIIPNMKHSLSESISNTQMPYMSQENCNIVSYVRSRYLEVKLEDLGRLVLSTYPMIYSSQDEHLDLPSLASVYRKDFQKARDRATA